MKNKFLTLLSLFLIALMAISGFQIWKTLSAYHTGEQVYADLRPTQTIGEPNISSSESEQTVSKALPDVDFTKLQAINADVIGWIYIPDTKINYPIVQGKDNTYYLQHLFTKEKNRAGCIFMDSRNHWDFSDLHTVLYGHHMKNIAMFSELERYAEPSFYEAHPTVWILTPEKTYQLSLFSGYVTENSSNAWQLFSSAEEEADWLETVVSASAFQSSVTPKAGDRIVTLSTCSYDFKDARFVLHGVLSEN